MSNLVRYHPLYEPYLVDAGLFTVLPLVPFTGDSGLITTLVERWRPETSTFHMPFGEMMITLEDIATLTGLAIDGDAVVVDIPDQDLRDMCLWRLGRAPTNLGSSPIRIAWLRETFDQLPHSASPETTE
ncbi:unnamed protein product [Linum tenue]|uniref:Aminotransferase-like plant mobile domain-containing protein n=2 Tax=Linum tenue TaxID=586396 RepID=A0AAV0HW97_9ROSI|nr:unnamed protein product [Linum tenue]